MWCLLNRISCFCLVCKKFLFWGSQLSQSSTEIYGLAWTQKGRERGYCVLLYCCFQTSQISSGNWDKSGQALIKLRAVSHPFGAPSPSAEQLQGEPDQRQWTFVCYKEEGKRHSTETQLSMLKRILVLRKLFPLNCLGPDIIVPKV